MTYDVKCSFLPVSSSFAESAWRAYLEKTALGDSDAKPANRRGLVSVVPADGGCFIVARVEDDSLISMIPSALLPASKRNRVRTKDFERFRTAMALAAAS